jgi:hypothetical protein
MKFPLIYLGAIAAAELITALLSLEAGMAFHIVLLLFLVLHSSSVQQHPNHKLYLALSLAPLIRILSLSMPLAGIPRIYWYIIIAVPLMGGVFLVIRRLGFGLWDARFAWRQVPLQLLIGLTGILIAIAEYHALQKPEPLVDSLTLRQVLLPALILLIATGFTEEIIFRGVIQRSAVEALHQWGWPYTASLFAILHISYLSVPHFFLLLAVGMFFGWLVLKTGSLLGVSLSHGITNILLYLILPFLF